MNRREFIRKVGIGIVAVPAIVCTATTPAPQMASMEEVKKEMGRAMSPVFNHNIVISGPAQDVTITDLVRHLQVVYGT